MNGGGGIWVARYLRGGTTAAPQHLCHRDALALARRCMAASLWTYRQRIACTWRRMVALKLLIAVYAFSSIGLRRKTYLGISLRNIPLLNVSYRAFFVGYHSAGVYILLKTIVTRVAGRGGCAFSCCGSLMVAPKHRAGGLARALCARALSRVPAAPLNAGARAGSAAGRVTGVRWRAVDKRAAPLRVLRCGAANALRGFSCWWRGIRTLRYLRRYRAK